MFRELREAIVEGWKEGVARERARQEAKKAAALGVIASKPSKDPEPPPLPQAPPTIPADRSAHLEKVRQAMARRQRGESKVRLDNIEEMAPDRKAYLEKTRTDDVTADIPTTPLFENTGTILDTLMEPIERYPYPAAEFGDPVRSMS